MRISLQFSSESVILRASPLMFIRPPCLVRGWLSHAVTSCFKKKNGNPNNFF